MITNYNVSGVTSTTLGQSSEVTSTSVVLSSEDYTTSVVHSSEDTSTTTVQSSEHISKKYPHEVLSSIPFQHSSRSPASIDKATASSTGNNILRGFFFIDFLMILLSSFIFTVILQKN